MLIDLYGMLLVISVFECFFGGDFNASASEFLLQFDELSQQKVFSWVYTTSINGFLDLQITLDTFYTINISMSLLCCNQYKHRRFMGGFLHWMVLWCLIKQMIKDDTSLN